VGGKKKKKLSFKSVLVFLLLHIRPIVFQERLTLMLLTTTTVQMDKIDF